MPMIGPWCLHKDVMFMEITTYSHPYRLFLCWECSGIRIEQYER